MCMLTYIPIEKRINKNTRYNFQKIMQNIFSSIVCNSYHIDYTGAVGITILVRIVRYHRTLLHSLQLTRYNDRINLI